jgi:hypothetical protein
VIPEECQGRCFDVSPDAKDRKSEDARDTQFVHRHGSRAGRARTMPLTKTANRQAEILPAEDVSELVLRFDEFGNGGPCHTFVCRLTGRNSFAKT